MEMLTTPLSHLFVTVFLYSFSVFMVVPAMTDVIMSAVCPGKDECSIAIYLTGLQQVIVGLGTLVMLPLIGNLSDTYGRKVILTAPMVLVILPSVILAYSRSAYYVYAYLLTKTVTSMICDGSVFCIALAYVADNVSERQRASAFGILSGIASCAFVCGNLLTRFISTSSTFQVSAAGTVIAVVYMRIFLPESVAGVGIACTGNKMENESLLKRDPPENLQVFRKMSSLHDTVSLLRTRSTFSQAAAIAFFNTLGDVGLNASVLYYLKAQFHYSKNQFADLIVINGIAGTISQMVFMPLIAPVIKEEKLLAIGLFFGCVHILLYSIAWSSWVNYAAAMVSVLSAVGSPCVRSIASKQVGPSEQGKAQGCLIGICSIANVIAPLAFSPLTALFLSESAPFYFPGFSLMCASLLVMIAFILSIMIREAPLAPSVSADPMDHSV
ncbi:Hippocampus abundant transcript 1 protein [Heracleum sosnowskyi]|uniref:Hippocampus abundant transcript 1 protein n=1 Tax=Heracleum sosnowskyi TaxID=360622 RepID=A0AAD8M4Y5_9APIA|nr:Hippocampus abundant transcript 1 protein [Heracleum sosnowskyi]